MQTHLQLAIGVTPEQARRFFQQHASAARPLNPKEIQAVTMKKRRPKSSTQSAATRSADSLVREFCPRCGMLRSQCDCWDPVNQP